MIQTQSQNELERQFIKVWYDVWVKVGNEDCGEVFFFEVRYKVGSKAKDEVRRKLFE